MIATVKQYVSNPSDCEDIIQDCLVKLIEKIPVLRGKERCVLCSYIVHTIRNRSINYLKRQGMINARTCNLEEQTILIASSELPMEEVMVAMERREQLDKIWNQLPEEYQLLLEGKYILKYTDAELATQLQCKPASIRMKLTRVRRKVFRMMSDNGGNRK